MDKHVKRVDEGEGAILLFAIFLYRLRKVRGLLVVYIVYATFNGAWVFLNIKLRDFQHL